ncbi:MAG: ATP-binding cassette domain-containing protein [candidate division Zixibacteria bacterium]|nr:ATP-binding cassette domain-containing protein [candidate division Zixibacteria bacterium]
MRYAIEVENMTFSYDGIPVLEEINFKLPEGEFMALLGPNGGGKTTLVKLLLGIYKPYSGKIKILGSSPEDAYGRIGYLPQDAASHSSFPITVYDAAKLGRHGRIPRGRGLSQKDKEIVRQKLELVEMWNNRHKRIGDLSGGQRQRVMIARALAVEPEILFFDEPTSSVDSSGQEKLNDLLKELNRDMTIVVITHDVTAISRHITSIACVNRKLHYHSAPELTSDMVKLAYGETVDGTCPVELLAHGIPHRVLPKHGDEGE